MSAIFSSAEPENQELISRINSAVGRRFFKPGKCALSKDALPFYREAFRLRATSFSTLPNVTKTFVFGRENVMVMDGTSEAVSEANELFGLRLSPANVTAYVSFFFSCLRTAEGKFRLIQTPEDIPFSVPVDNSLIQILDELLSPASVAEEKGRISAETVLFCMVQRSTEPGCRLCGGRKSISETRKPFMNELAGSETRLR